MSAVNFVSVFVLFFLLFFCMFCAASPAKYYLWNLTSELKIKWMGHLETKSLSNIFTYYVFYLSDDTFFFKKACSFHFQEAQAITFILFWCARFAIVWKKGYQEFENVHSAVTTKLKGVVYTNFTNIPGLRHRIWDVADYVVPPQVGYICVLTEAKWLRDLSFSSLCFIQCGCQVRSWLGCGSVLYFTSSVLKRKLDWLSRPLQRRVSRMSNVCLCMVLQTQKIPRQFEFREMLGDLPWQIFFYHDRWTLMSHVTRVALLLWLL